MQLVGAEGVSVLDVAGAGLLSAVSSFLHVSVGDVWGQPVFSLARLRLGDLNFDYSCGAAMKCHRTKKFNHLNAKLCVIFIKLLIGNIWEVLPILIPRNPVHRCIL